jgi:hypothetical protein
MRSTPERKPIARYASRAWSIFESALRMRPSTSDTENPSASSTQIDTAARAQKISASGEAPTVRPKTTEKNDILRP